MTTSRRVLAAVLALLALGTALMVVDLEYGLAATYGGSTSMLGLAIIPVLLGVGAAAARGTAGGVVAVVAFTVLVIAAGAVAGPLGERARTRAAAERDATFACNRPSSEFLVPDVVDHGWDDFEHPFHLYGPVSQSRYGCTAAIAGPVADTWGPWRRSLLAAGWEVERDDASRVAVTDGVLRAVLHEQDGLAMLTLSTAGAGECAAGGSAGGGDGAVSGC